jgi:hypothetical protein
LINEELWTILRFRSSSRIRRALRGSRWEALGDTVSTQRIQVRRNFEDRTNADVRWVHFQNCGFTVSGHFRIESISGFYDQPGDVVLESHNQYKDKFVLYGFQDGHTYFDA